MAFDATTGVVHEGTAPWGGRRLHEVGQGASFRAQDKQLVSCVTDRSLCFLDSFLSTLIIVRELPVCTDMTPKCTNMVKGS